MESTSAFVRESETADRDGLQHRQPMAATGWETVVFELEDDPRGLQSERNGDSEE